MTAPEADISTDPTGGAAGDGAGGAGPRCGYSCRRCADFFTCRLPACPDCPDRRWRRSHQALERLFEEMTARRG